METEPKPAEITQEPQEPKKKLKAYKKIFTKKNTKASKQFKVKK